MSYKIPIGLTTYAGTEVTSESSWITIGRWLDGVASSQIWRQEARSFSAWLSTQAERLGLGDASLWRFLTAARNLEVIKRDLEQHASDGAEPSSLAEMLSPEAIELACKIRRFAPVDVLLSLFYRLTQGKVTRAELREIWSSYRDMEGKKRPRALDTPLSPPVAPPQKSASGAPLAAPEMGPTWFAELDVFWETDSPRIRREFHNPRLTGVEGLALKEPLADRVLVIQETAQDPLRLLALFDLGRSGRRGLVNRIQAASPFVDAVWLIQYRPSKVAIWSGVESLTAVGVVQIDLLDYSWQVLRKPTSAPTSDMTLRAATLESLLSSVLSGDGSLQHADPDFASPVPFVNGVW